MKKAIKIIAITCLALIILVILGLKFAPIFAKNYIVDNSEKFIGRKIEIENINLNPFTFVITIDTFKILEQDKKTPFVSFDKFRINLDPLKIITKTLSIDEIYMKSLYVHVTQNKTQFNFSDIIEHLSKNDSTKNDSNLHAFSKKETFNEKDTIKNISITEITNKLPFNFVVKNILFENGNIIYEDKAITSKFHLQDFNVLIPEVYLSNKETNVGINLKFKEGGDLKVKIDANASTCDFNINIQLNNFLLNAGKPYLNEFINYKDFNGKISTNILVNGNLNNILASNVSGLVSLDSIILTDVNNKTIGVNSINIGINQVNLNENKFHLDSLIVEGAFLHLDLYKNKKTNIDILLEKLNTKTEQNNKENEPNDITNNSQNNSPNENSKVKVLDAVINKLIVKNTSVTANDETIIKPFHYTVNQINVEGKNINFNKPCTINISANLPEGGKALLKYEGSLNDISTMDAYISVKNLALKNFSNYSLHYTGYPLSDGTFTFASENKINNFKLDSKNIIDIYNINVGDKDDNIDPEYMVPMKIGLYILKDKDDKIQFDIPIQGDIKDPEFSVIKIVWKTIMNLLIKVAVSPLKIVGNVANASANAVGINLQKNDEINIDATKQSFTSEQYEKASKMTLALQKDPKLKLIYTQYYNPNKLSTQYKEIKLKTDFYKQVNGKEVLNELDEQAILEINSNDSTFKDYVNLHEKNLDLKMLKKELFDLANKRNENLKKVLIEQKGVNTKNIKVITAPAKSLSNYKGNPMYKVTVDVQ